MKKTLKNILTLLLVIAFALIAATDWRMTLKNWRASADKPSATYSLAGEK